MMKEWRHIIKSDPRVMMGKPVITGTIESHSRINIGKIGSR